LHEQCTLLSISVVSHVDLVYQEMICEVSDLNGRECFDFLEKFYVYQQQYYACGTNHKSDYTIEPNTSNCRNVRDFPL